MSSNDGRDRVDELGSALTGGLSLGNGTISRSPLQVGGHTTNSDSINNNNTSIPGVSSEHAPNGVSLPRPALPNGLSLPRPALPNGTTSCPALGGGHQERSAFKLQPRRDHLTWEEYFMAVAFLSAQRSKDPVSQVGACIVNTRNQIVGIGYNGMPRGCHDKDMPWGKTSPDPEDNKYMYVCHAELNAILNKNSADVTGCAIYVALFPCNECAKLIIQAGINKIIYYSDKHKHKPHTIASKRMLDMANVQYRRYESGRRKLTLDFKAVYPDEDGCGGGLQKRADEGPVAGSTKGLFAGGEEGRSQLSSTESPRTLDQYISWEVYFMAVAFLSAQRSKDPLSQVGACIVNTDKRIVAIGYNGMPNGCPDDSMPWHDSPEDTENNKKYYVCHAELNAILNKNSADVRGCTMYVTLFPCNECAKLISQAGLREVVYYAAENGGCANRRAAEDILSRADVRINKFNTKLRTLIPIDFESIER